VTTSATKILAALFSVLLIYRLLGISILSSISKTAFRSESLWIGILEKNGVSVDVTRAVDHQIAPGVYPDMTEHGVERDVWTEIYKKVLASDILVNG